MEESGIKRDFMGMFDVLKGHIMFFIIFVHSLKWVGKISGGISNQLDIINKFFDFDVIAMCLMFLFIGYTFKAEQNIKKHFCKMLRIFLVPYFLTSIVMILIDVIDSIIRGNVGLGMLSAPIIGVVLGVPGTFNFRDLFWINGINNMWFIVAAFIGECIYNLSFQIKNNKTRIALIIVLSVSATFIPSKPFLLNNLGIFIPWVLPAALITPGIFEVGYTLKKTKFFYKKFNSVLSWGTAIIITALCGYAHFHFKSDISTWEYTYYFVDLIIGLLGSILIVKIYLALNVPFWDINAPAEFIGRYSLHVFCAHSIGTKITEVCYAECDRVMYYMLNSSVSPWIVTLVLYIFNLALTAVFFLGIYKLEKSYTDFKLKRIKNGN